MTRSIETWLDRWLPAWVEGVRRRATAIVVGSVAVTLAAVAVTATSLRVETDQDALFDEGVLHRVVEAEYWRIFPVLHDNVVIVVDAETIEQARSGASALAARLDAQPELFHSVYRPTGDFFEEHALLYMETDELQDFADRLARVQPYLASLAEDGSLRGLAMMLARGVRALRDGDVNAESLEPMFERVDAALAASIEGQAYRLSWAEVIAGGELAADAKRQLILAQPVPDFTRLNAASASLEAVRRISDELGLTEENGVRVRMTGDVALAYEEMGLVEGQARAAGVASFVIVAALLLFGLRSMRVVGAALVSLVVGLALTGAFAAISIGHLNLISIAFAVLFIGLGIDFGVHLGMGYQESLARGADHAGALAESARKIGGSLVLCAITTAIGFYVFVPTDFAGVAELGLISGTGMLISLVCSFTVLPAVLSVGVREETASSAARRAQLRWAPGFPLRHPVPIVAVTAVLALGAVLVLPRAHFDQNPLRVRDPAAVSVQTFEELLEQSRTSPWSLNAIRPDLESAEALARELRALPTVESAHTVRGFVPTDQGDKLEIIEEVAMFLAPPPSQTPQPPDTAEIVAALEDFEKELRLLARTRPDAAGLSKSAAAVRGSLASLLAELRAQSPEDAEATVRELEESLVGTLASQLDRIQRLVAVDEITLDALPEGLVERMVSADGQVRVRIFPAEDLMKKGALSRFIDSVRAVEPRVSGDALAVESAGREVVKALQQAFTAAVLAIAVLLFVIWRTVEDTAMVMAPMVLAGLFTGAGAVVLGIPFNFADVIVLPLLLGIGVDTSIHLVHRARIADPRDAELLQTSTANAVVLSALTTVASFGTLALASHRGMASLGQLLTLGVSLTVVCNLVVLPALLELRRRHRAHRPA